SDAVYLRPAEFQPTSQKWAGEICHGVHIHVIEPKRIHTYALGLAIIRAAMDMDAKAFQWKAPGYEYNHKDLPIDLILGELDSHKKLEAGLDLKDPFWSRGEEEYARQFSETMIYRRQPITGLW
ncbi:MAG: DUF1343 domain-containing protein, partial [Proteobacteria bacterium]